VVAWYGWVYFHEALTKGWRTETVWSLPLWIPLLPLPVGMGLLSLQYVADIACLLTGREAPFGMDQEEAE
jgi:TRAP-type C4-dicarboxylate transport system permease small subunit